MAPRRSQGSNHQMRKPCSARQLLAGLCLVGLVRLDWLPTAGGQESELGWLAQSQLAAAGAECPAPDVWRSSGLFVEPFEPGLACLPGAQLAVMRESSRETLQLFKKILHEAVEIRDQFAPSAKLMLKYTVRLIDSFIRQRRLEAQLAAGQRHNLKPDFFHMLAQIIERGLDRSGELKSERRYTKQNVQADQLLARLDALLHYVQRVMDSSPVGGYLKWDKLRLFADQPDRALEAAEEGADLGAVS